MQYELTCGDNIWALVMLISPNQGSDQTCRYPKAFCRRIHKRENNVYDIFLCNSIKFIQSLPVHDKKIEASIAFRIERHPHMLWTTSEVCHLSYNRCKL